MGDGETNFGKYFALTVPTGGYVKGKEIGVKVDGKNHFSIESWLFLNGMGNDISVIKKKGVFNFGISHGKLYLQIADSAPFYSDGYVNVTSGKWHYVAISYDTSYLRFYINGMQYGKISTSLTGTENSEDYHIASNIDGHMRILRIYDTCLNSAEIHSHMFNNSLSATPCADIDFTRNPPVDHRRPTAILELAERSRISQLEPALYLQGTAYAELAKTEKLNPAGRQIDPYTVQASIYVTGAKPHQTVFVNGNHDVNVGMALYLTYFPDQSGYKLYALRGADTDAANKVISNTIIHTDEWTNVAVTFDGQSVRLYINGKLDVQEDNVGPVLLPMENGELLIGGMLECGRATGTNTLQGYIQRVDVWERTLSASEIEKYAKDNPEIDDDHLVESFDFTNEPYRGVKLDIPVALYDNARFKELVKAVSGNICEPRVKQSFVYADHTFILKERQKLNIQNIEARFTSMYTPMMAGSAEELSLILGIKIDAVQAALLKERISVVCNDSNDILLTVNHYIEGTDYVVIAHYRSASYAVARCPVDTIDDCILLIIEMIFLLIGGAISAIFGLKTTLSSKAIDFIKHEVMVLASVKALLAKGEKVTAGDVFQLGYDLHSNGTLKPLVHLMVTLGFWSMIRLLAKIVLTFLGVGWADTIASLIATAIAFGIKFIDYLRLCLPLPQITLREVNFNHNPLRSDNSALNIRKNAAVPTALPEWVNGITNEPAAYAAAQLNNVQIKARFIIASPLPYTVNIRGVASAGNQFGNLGPMAVTFTLGSSGIVSFTVSNAVLPGLTIGKHTVIWNWQYWDTVAAVWIAIAAPAHTVYILADLPTLPWSQLPALSANWPWADFLDRTSTWLPVGGVAQGTSLANIFTQAINTSGMIYLGARGYNALLPGFVTVSFNLTLFLLNSGGALGFAGISLECSDCAHLLTLATRVWGGEHLCAVRFNNGPAGQINTSFLQSIGFPAWLTNAWNYHVMASAALPPTAATSDVYDCCIHIDASTNPWGPMPRIPAIPGEPAHPMQSGALTLGLFPPYPYPAPPAKGDYYNRLLDNALGYRVGIFEINEHIITIL